MTQERDLREIPIRHQSTGDHEVILGELLITGALLFTIGMSILTIIFNLFPGEDVAFEHPVRNTVIAGCMLLGASTTLYLTHRRFNRSIRNTDISRLKDLYVEADGTPHFGYMLIDHDLSTSKHIVIDVSNIDIAHGEHYVKNTDPLRYQAMQNYKKQSSQSNAWIYDRVQAIYDAKQHEDSLKVQQLERELYEKTPNLELTPLFKTTHAASEQLNQELELLHQTKEQLIDNSLQILEKK